MEDNTHLKTFRLEGQVTLPLNLSIPQATLLVVSISSGMLLSEVIGIALAFVVAIGLAFITFNLHSLFIRLFPGERFNSFRDFFFQGDLYVPIQDIDTIPIRIIGKESRS